SSNVGISQISWRLTGEEFRDGLLNFGIAKPSGLDLSRDLPGQLKPLHLLNNKMHRANSSYGYGMLVTFAQLFKAYSAFNNDGVAVTPRIVDYLGDRKGKRYTLKPKMGNTQAVGKKAANQIHNILLEVVKRGTGVKAQYPGLEIGGKTGTAHIAKHGHYVREYHSSFYGFANDKQGNKYTIGVLVIKAKKYHKYFASQSAVPTFKNITKILVEQGYLKPDPKEMIQEDKESSFYGNKEKDVTASKPTTPAPTISTHKKEKIIKSKKVKKSTKPKKQSIKSLFNLKKKTKLKKKPKPKIDIQTSKKTTQKKPAKQKSANELFEDLF
ncbi:MAG TPA: penicillin-binding protein 2, partial [Epsilonproteobacteria bacterium]|nr:penicillin-binding protein 2 [Campylobacterota bacterium]